MKVIGFSGLHGAGKSHAARHLSRLSGWPLCGKLDILRSLRDASWHMDRDTEWDQWYRSVYVDLGGEAVIRRVLETLGDHPVCILDAIHSPKEWRAIIELHPGSLLVAAFAPEAVRAARRNESTGKDETRIQFWHDSGTCLQSYVDWAIPGMLPSELLDLVCREFIAYVQAPP